MSAIRLYQPRRINFFEFFSTLKAVLRDSTHPRHISLVYGRNNMRVMGIFPSKQPTESFSYELYNMAIIGCLFLFIVSIACDLYEASNDFVMFGDDLVVLLGLLLIFIKIVLQRQRSDEIEQIVSNFDEMHRKNGNSENTNIRYCQRTFFIFEAIMAVTFLSLACFFCLVILAQPLVAPQPLPFRSKYPYSWHDPQQHPIMHALIYVFQFFCCSFNLLAIIFLDQTGCHMLSQTTVNLRIISIRLRDLGRDVDDTSENLIHQLHDIIKFHQNILAFAEKIMSIFYWNYVAQMGSSTFIICLTAYETLLVQNQPMVALKFLLYMLTAFGQIFYWCLMGNMVYYDSIDVARAGFEVQNWCNQPKSFQRDLMFLIHRAQKPLIFRAQPLFGFTFQSFTSILSTSYSYFTLLRTMKE